ncbi:hypothetical protein AB4500_24450, partial [Vibrio sp. 10N.222.48.A11]
LRNKASIAKVHETQNELLSEIGIETDVNNFIATKLAIASDEIAELTNKSQKELDDIGGVEGAKEKL